MVLNYQEMGERTLVVVEAKRLDAAVAEDFKKQMVEIATSGRNWIVLDLSSVEFIDSSGLGAMVGAYKQIEQKGSLELACPSPPVQKVLSLTRMNRVFVIHETVPQG